MQLVLSATPTHRPYTELHLGTDAANIVIVNHNAKEHSLLNNFIADLGQLHYSTIEQLEASPVDANVPSLVLLDLDYSYSLLEDIHWAKEYCLHHRASLLLICSKPERLGPNDPELQVIKKPFTPLQIRKSVQVAIHLAQKCCPSLAQKDPITCCFNREYFDEMLEQTWLIEDQTLTMALVQLDYFREFQESYGIHAANHCLKQVAGALEETSPDKAIIIARYSQEKFALVWQGARQPALVEWGQSMLRAINDLSIPHGHSIRSPFVTASAGIHQRLQHQPLGQFIESAYATLAQAKCKGQNQLAISKTAHTAHIESGPEQARRRHLNNLDANHK